MNRDLVRRITNGFVIGLLVGLAIGIMVGLAFALLVLVPPLLFPP